MNKVYYQYKNGEDKHMGFRSKKEKYGFWFTIIFSFIFGLVCILFQI